MVMREYTKQKHLIYSIQKNNYPGLIEEDCFIGFPADYSLVQEVSLSKKIFEKTLDKGLCEAIDKFHETVKVSKKSIFLSALMILLNNYTRESKVIVHSPIEDWSNVEVKNLYDFVSNVLVYKVSMDKSKSVNNTLCDVSDIIMEANQYHKEFIRNIDNRSELDVLMVDKQILTVQFIYSDIHNANTDTSDKKENPLYADITLCVIEKGNENEVYIQYNKELYMDVTVQYILNHYVKTLHEIIDKSNSSVGDIDIITEEEKNSILNYYNNTTLTYPDDMTIPELFERQVALCGNHTAVVINNESVTYQELNQKSNCIAFQLRTVGVQANDIVGIMVDRSINMIASIIGVLKSGAAYLPIDPTYPAERIKYILLDSKPKQIITDYYKEQIPSNIQIIDLKNKDLWNNGGENFKIANSQNDLAYIIYTSGSTGKPKGVMVEHRGVVSLKSFFCQEYRITKEDKILQFANISFDASVWEITMALLNGATLILVPTDTIADTEKFELYCKEKKVTVATLPPIYCMALKNFAVRLLITAGSEANEKLIHKYKECCHYVNAYGPTETTVCATHWRYDEKEACSGNIPIGKPIANTQVYILDNDKLCGVGIPGEICVSGVGVARGYINQPELSNQKFIENKFGSGKLYRTGDLGRWLPNGNIEFIGRIDMQVKIRGFRIELGEIEYAIRKNTSINDVAIFTHKDTNGENVIYACMVANCILNMEDMRDFLEKTLPYYMIPNHMIQVEAIPVTRNGKIDKHALLNNMRRDDRIYEPPTTEYEKLACQCFEEILKLNNVGINESFFELGGHSIGVGILVNMIEEKVQIRLLNKDIFKEKTPARIAALLEQGKKVSYNPITKVEKQEYYPITSPQQRLFMVAQMDETGIAYNLPCVYKVNGLLDKLRVQEALEDIVQRNEIFRTCFHIINGETMAHIKEKEEICLTFMNLEMNRIDDIMLTFNRPFNLNKDPLMRVLIGYTADNTSIVFLNFHHIIMDGISMNIFWREFTRLYNGEKPTSSDIQFKDYAAWIRKEEFIHENLYWRERLSTEVEPFNLPVDYQRPALQSFEGRSISEYMSIDNVDNIHELAKKTGCTDFMIYMSALMLLLSKYSGQEDILIGSVVSGRTHKDLESIMGMFVNTIIYRGHCKENHSYLDFLFELQQQCIEVYDNQRLPFEQIVALSGVKRELSHNPLYDVMFVFQDYNEEIPKLDGMSCHELAKDEWNKSCKNDLTVIIHKVDRSYRITFEYCDKLFSEWNMQYMLAHYIEILSEITLYSDKTLGEINGVNTFEEKRIIHEFNKACSANYEESSIQKVFENIVEKQPNHIALVFKNKKLTYKDLNDRANAVAEELQNRSVTKMDIVGIMAERSVEMIIGILGIIKSGATYIPIDPGYPKERINYMISDCKPKIILTYHVQIDSEVPSLRLEEMYHLKTTRNVIGNAGLSDLAYIIYTSGTTGKPKGVMVENKGVVNLANFFQSNYHIDKNDNILQFANISFDASVWEITMALLTGATLVVLPPDLMMDTEKFEEYCQTNKVTVATLPPQYYLSLKNFEPRLLITAGSESSKKLLNKIPNTVQYINAYGPTETTVCATHWKYTDKAFDRNSVPIGIPIDNTQVYILSNNKLCGIGIPGEIYIGGIGLARGYLNQIELTNKKFIKNPYGEGKIYASGDIGRWLPDGKIEYLGRVDEQVKIRGYRIELAEIDSAIKQCYGVEDAITIVTEDFSGDKIICSYYVSESNISSSEVKQQIKTILPTYMIPVHIIQTKSIVLNRNGKVDKSKLQKPIYVESDEIITFSNEEERILLRAFQDVLQCSAVSTKDDFFDLGGDSIKAIRLVSQIREDGYSVTVKDIMLYSTVSEIAKHMEKQGKTQNVEENVNGVCPLSHIQRKFFKWNLKNRNHFNQSIMLRTKKLDKQALERVLHAIVEKHDMLRSTYQGEEQVIMPVEEANLYDIEYHDISSYNKESQSDIIEKLCEVIQSSINILSGPLMKVGIFTGKEEDYVMIAIHHLVVDAISWKILLDDLNRGYSQVIMQQSIQLTKKTISYKSWILHVNEYATNTGFEKERKYWDKIKKSAELFYVKDDCFVFNASTNRALSYKKSVVNSELTNKLTHKALKKYSTKVNDLLLTALARTLYHVTHNSNIVISLESHGRHDVGKNVQNDGTIGWFTNIYPVEIPVKDCIKDDIITTKECLRSIPNNGMGISLLEDYDSLITDVIFNYLGELNYKEADKENKLVVVDMSTGKNIADDNLMVYGIMIDAQIVNETVIISLQYDNGRYSDCYIDNFLSHYNTCLQEIIEHCTSDEEIIKTVSDVGAKDLEEFELDELNNLLEMLN
ncbi:surfactin family lipopeptide synthetase A [Anaerosporobacter mobilis DSM 15930]|uniref:Surfactin family lipopeptide synthetase A n=2 Tax=Anaerosporobacter TaxID=653683 RepID=A0A1M7JFC4_9FIRM|nr:surfactin family lipopeptide synthetase A [Anaerosporobacter mobilis DSM 15930]